MARLIFDTHRGKIVIFGLLAVILIAGLGSFGHSYQQRKTGLPEARRSTVNASDTAAKAAANQLVAADAGSKLSSVSQPPVAAPQSGTTWPAVPPAPAMAVSSLALATSGTILSPGDNLTLTLYESSGMTPVNTIQAKLTYDANALEFVGTLDSADFGLEAATDTATPGIIRIARAAQGSTPSGTHAVVNLHFTVKQGATGSQSVAVDAGASYIVRASDSANILQTVSAANLMVQNR